MTLITEAYREQNRVLHEDPVYGYSGHKVAKKVLKLCTEMQTLDVLDYGCGKQTLQMALSFPIQGYDPCIAGLDKPPVAADIVVCSDVLEHIEPECLSEVLDDIRRLTKRKAFLTVATRPARKTLPDGRNAHLIQETPAWWLPQLLQRFSRMEWYAELCDDDKPVGFMVIVRA